ncbi:hypothetical protein ACVIGA_000275 [Bradyrhizobium sp. USDA 3240]
MSRALTILNETGDVTKRPGIDPVARGVETVSP